MPTLLVSETVDLLSQPAMSSTRNSRSHVIEDEKPRLIVVMDSCSLFVSVMSRFSLGGGMSLLGQLTRAHLNSGGISRRSKTLASDVLVRIHAEKVNVCL